MVDDSLQRRRCRDAALRKLLADEAAQAAFIADLSGGATAKAAIARRNYSAHLWYAARRELKALDDAWTSATGVPQRPAASWPALTARRFFDELARTGSPEKAAELVGRTAAQAYRRRSQDARFARDWELAVARTYDAIGAKAVARLLGDEAATALTDKLMLLVLARRGGRSAGEADKPAPGADRQASDRVRERLVEQLKALAAR